MSVRQEGVSALSPRTDWARRVKRRRPRSWFTISSSEAPPSFAQPAQPAESRGGTLAARSNRGPAAPFTQRVDRDRAEQVLLDTFTEVLPPRA